MNIDIVYLRKLLEKHGVTIAVSFISAVTSVTMFISAIQNNIISLQNADAAQVKIDDAQQRELDNITTALKEFPAVVQELKSNKEAWKSVDGRLGNIEAALFRGQK